MAIVGLKVEDGVVFSISEQSGNWERAGIDLIPGLEELLKRLESLSYSISGEESVIFSDANECAMPQKVPPSRDAGRIPSKVFWPTDHNVNHARSGLENVSNHTVSHMHAKGTSFKEPNGHKTALMSMLRCLDKHYHGSLNQDYPEILGVSYIRKDTVSARGRLNGDLIKAILRYSRLYSTDTPESRFYLEKTGAPKDPR